MNVFNTDLINHLLAVANLSAMQRDLVNHFFLTDYKLPPIAPFANKYGMTKTQVKEERNKVAGILKDVCVAHRITCVADVI